MSPTTSKPPSADPSLGRVIGIAVVGAVVAGCLIGGIGTGLSQADPPSYAPPPGSGGGQPTSGDYSNLATGARGPSTAAEPTVCPTACFDEDDVELAILPDDLFTRQYLASYKHVWKMTGDRTTASALLTEEHDEWDRAGYTPDECFVTWSDRPIVEDADTVLGDGLVAPIAEHSSDTNYLTVLTQSVRLFESSDDAEAYMSTLAHGVDVCNRYVALNGLREDDVSAEPALHVPDSVAAVGFVRTPRAGLRYYVMDLQRGNLVIRSIAVSDGGINDDKFRVLMQQQANAIGTIPPSDAVVPTLTPEPTPGG